MSFLNVDRPGSVATTVGFTVTCLVNDGNAATERIKVAAMIIFFMIVIFIS
jgi:hypothetical protein